LRSARLLILGAVPCAFQGADFPHLPALADRLTGRDLRPEKYRLDSVATGSHAPNHVADRSDHQARLLKHDVVIAFRGNHLLPTRLALDQGIVRNADQTRPDNLNPGD
jgi:hypothetical protein